MDEVDLQRLILKCKHLRHRFKGIYAADQIPIAIPNGSFIIVNTDNSDKPGSHWVLLCNVKNLYMFADPLGMSVKSYESIYTRMQQNASKLVSEVTNVPIQPWNSGNCGLYCLYLAHFYFNNAKVSKVPIISENQLLQFVKHMY